MAKRLSAAAVADKWANRTANAADAMKAGVAAVTEAPTQKAAAAKDKWLAGVQAAAANGRFEDGLNAVSLQDWQKAMTDKGIPNMANGVRMAKQKMQNFLTNFLPFAQQVSDEIAAMPSGTVEDSRARMNRNFDRMREYSSRR
jgi:hypothetical protein